MSNVADGIANFVPYYLAQIAVMAWLSRAAVLPVMTDVSQLLAAREILTAVAVGLFPSEGAEIQGHGQGRRSQQDGDPVAYADHLRRPLSA